jgi:hypothetical protein
MGSPISQSLPRRNVHIPGAILRMVEAGKHRAKEGEKWLVSILDTLSGYNSDGTGRGDEGS